MRSTVFLLELMSDIADWIGDRFDGSVPLAPPAVFNTADMGLPSGTQEILDMTNQMTADAHTLYDDAMNPGSVPMEEVAAANARIDSAAQDSGLIAGGTYRQEITNDVRLGELDMQGREELHQIRMDVTQMTHGEA